MIRKPKSKKITKRKSLRKNPESKVKQEMLKYLRKKRKEFYNEDNYDSYGLNSIDKLITQIEAIKDWGYIDEISFEQKDPNLEHLLHKIRIKSEIYSKLDEICFNFCGE